jgi:hypothetical protein
MNLMKTFGIIAIAFSFYSGANAHAQTGGFSPVRLTTDQFKAWEDHPSTDSPIRLSLESGSSSRIPSARNVCDGARL